MYDRFLEKISGERQGGVLPVVGFPRPLESPTVTGPATRNSELTIFLGRSLFAILTSNFLVVLRFRYPVRFARIRHRASLLEAGWWLIP